MRQFFDWTQGSNHDHSFSTLSSYIFGSESAVVPKLAWFRTPCNKRCSSFGRQVLYTLLSKQTLSQRNSTTLLPQRIVRFWTRSVSLDLRLLIVQHDLVQERQGPTCHYTSWSWGIGFQLTTKATMPQKGFVAYMFLTIDVCTVERNGWSQISVAIQEPTLWLADWRNKRKIY